MLLLLPCDLATVLQGLREAGVQGRQDLYYNLASERVARISWEHFGLSVVLLLAGLYSPVPYAC